MLRTPLLLSESHWIPSLSICLRAAQLLLSVYFDIFAPAITIIVNTPPQGLDDSSRRQIQEAVRLPPTWRQVRRIVASAFIAIYAFWTGEAAAEETCRSLATVVLLLEFQRTRWGSKVDSAVATIQCLSSASNLSLQGSMRGLLPNAGEEFFASMSVRLEDAQHPVVVNSAPDVFQAEQGRSDQETLEIFCDPLESDAIFGNLPVFADFLNSTC